MSADTEIVSAIKAHLDGLAAERATMTLLLAEQGAAIVALRAEIERLKNHPPPVEPPAEPPPPPPPPVEPPAPVDATVHSRTLNMARLLLWAPWLEQSRYQRFQKLALVKPGAATVTLRATDQAAGGANRAFAAAQYVVTADGQHHATISPAPGTVSFDVPFDLTRLAEGWHWIDVRTDGVETCAPYHLYVQHGATPVPQPSIPIVTGSHTASATGIVQWTNLPATYAPTTAPLLPREYPLSDAPVTRASIVQTTLAPVRNGDHYRPMDIGGGCLAALSRQWYFFSSLTAARPNLPSFDGPRGIGAVGMATHLQVGRNGGVYFTDAWRIGHISAKGVVKTLAGYRHKQPMHYEAATDAAVELVGDWSAIPPARRGFHELWGMAWDTRTLAVSGTPIKNGDNGPEQPHTTGPVLFVADSQNNRVCRIEFDPASHDAPPRITEFITGLRDPWDCSFADGKLYVSERQSHRICEYNADTGALIRVVVQGLVLATIRSDRKMIRTAPLDIIRAQPCVGPEGLYVQDGWLYFASLSMGQVRKIHLTTGELITLFDVPPSEQAMYLKIAVSDGSFGPRGMVAVTMWNVENWGRPALFTPDGKPVGWINTGGGGQGPGPVFETIGYSGAVGIGLGRMVCSSAAEGIVQFSRALPTDKFISAADWRAARTEYAAAGHDLTNGTGGWGFFGLPLPWGKSVLIDQYLTACGHER